MRIFAVVCIVVSSAYQGCRMCWIVDVRESMVGVVLVMVFSGEFWIVFFVSFSILVESGVREIPYMSIAKGSPCCIPSSPIRMVGG